MINRFMMCIYYLLIFVFQLTFLPHNTNAATKVQQPENHSNTDTSISSSALLQVSQTVNRDVITVGEYLNHELTVYNTSSTAVASNIRVFDRLPAGFGFKNGSFLLNGSSNPDPVISNDGKTFIFKIGNLAPNASSTIRFVTEVTANSKPGKTTHYVSAISAGGGSSNIAKSAIIINENKQATPQTIIAASPQTGETESIKSERPSIVPSEKTELKQAEPAPLLVADNISQPITTIPAIIPPATQVTETEPIKAEKTDIAPPEKAEIKSSQINQDPAPQVIVESNSQPVVTTPTITPAVAQTAEPEVVKPEKAAIAPLEKAEIKPSQINPEPVSQVIVENNSQPAVAPSSTPAVAQAVEQEIVKPEKAAITPLEKVEIKPSQINPEPVSQVIVENNSQPAVAPSSTLAVAQAVEQEIIKPEKAAITPSINNESIAPQIASADKQTDSTIVPVVSTPKAITTNEHNVNSTFVIPDSQSLSNLIGSSTISVLSDVDGQFVNNMSKILIFENEVARKVDETNLLEAIRAGRNFSRESLASLARKEQAKAQTGQAFALLLPSVSVRASYGSEISQPGVLTDADGKPQYSEHSRTDLGLTVRQPLLDMPTFLDWRKREVTEKVRGENYRVSDSDAYLSTLNSYLNLVSSRLQIDMTRDFEKQLTDLLTYIEKRTSAGAASVSDLSRVRARSQATKSFRLEQEASHAAAGIEFVSLTNLVPQKVRLPLLEDVEITLLPKSFDTAVSTAIKNNPEITSLAAELQAANMDKSVAKSRYLPRVDAEYTDTFALHAGGAKDPSGQRDRRLMMVMNWNLFSGGSDYNNNLERIARYKELQYRLDDQHRRIVQTLSANYATLETTRKRISSGYNELKAISTAADAMSKRMLSGNQSLMDLLDVYDRYYQIRSRLVSLHVQEISTVGQLIRLTLGTPGKSSEIITEASISK